jgi:alpha-glucosidase
MAEYTSGGDKLDMCYSFEFLDKFFTAEHFRSRVKGFFSAGPGGWPCWSFSNHDVQRHITRWAPHGADRDALARQSAMLLLTLRGSVCLYQGEELGLPEADILFEELTDPPGIRFWPEYKGRDGCRTPIPWQKGKAPNGFTTGRPWLPVKAPHSALSVQGQEADPNSMLNFYRKAIAFRSANPALVDGGIDFIATDEPVLAFRRTGTENNLLCVFNLSAKRQRVTVENAGEPMLSGYATRTRNGLDLDASGFAIFSSPASSRPGIKFKRRTTKKKAAG